MPHEGKPYPATSWGGSGRIFDSKGVQLIADTENGILHSAEVEGEVADPLDSGLQDDGGRPGNHPILNLHRQSLRDNARNAQSGDGDATHGRECAKPWISDDDYGLSDGHVPQSESLSDGLAMTSYDVYDESILSDDHVLSRDRQGHGRPTQDKDHAKHVERGNDHQPLVETTTVDRGTAPGSMLADADTTVPLL